MKNIVQNGACMVHGHCHGRVDEYNVKTGNMRVDVGFVRISYLFQCVNIHSQSELLQYA